MKALDTNILVRFLMADDKDQVTRVMRLFSRAMKEREKLFVATAVLLETIWVITRAYGASRQDTLDNLDRLLQLPFLVWESEQLLRELISLGNESSLDLSDLVIGLAAREHGCETTLTFDRKSARSGLFELP